MEQVLEAPATSAPLMGSVAAVSAARDTTEQRSPKSSVRLRFAAVFVLLLVFAPTFAAMLWLYLKHRY